MAWAVQPFEGLQALDSTRAHAVTDSMGNDSSKPGPKQFESFRTRASNFQAIADKFTTLGACSVR